MRDSMFIPLHDANSLKHIRLQYVTIGLIVANVIVFLLTSTASAAGRPSRAALWPRLHPVGYLRPGPAAARTRILRAGCR